MFLKYPFFHSVAHISFVYNPNCDRTFHLISILKILASYVLCTTGSMFRSNMTSHAHGTSNPSTSTSIPHVSSSRNSKSPELYYDSIFNDSDCERRRRKFRSIDELSNFEYYMKLLQDVNTTNFVLDFGDEEAWCALDLEDGEFARLLEKPVSFFFFFLSWL